MLAPSQIGTALIKTHWRLLARNEAKSLQKKLDRQWLRTPNQVVPYYESVMVGNALKAAPEWRKLSCRAS